MGILEDASREAIGINVKVAREARGLSVRAAASRGGFSAATWTAIEHGRTQINADRLRDLGVALQCSPDELRSGGPLPARSRPRPTAPWRSFEPLPVDPALAGAIAAFVETGYHGASMRLVAEKAGMSVPGVYHHYASKQDLLVRILDLTMSELKWRMDSALAQARRERLDPVLRLALLIEAMALFHARRRDLAFIGASEMRSLQSANRRRIASIRRDVQHVLDAQIDICRRRGLVQIEHPREAGRAIATMCTSLCQWFRPSGVMDPQDIAAEYTALALRMLGAALPDGYRA